MAFEELKENAENVQFQAKAYIESNVAYYKLWGFKVAMKSVTLVFKFTLIVICFLMVLLFISISAALAIGNCVNSTAIGFLIIGVIYLILTGLLFLIKDKTVEGPILEKFSEIFFND